MCSRANCTYCTVNQKHSDEELHFLPDPDVDEVGQYKNFSNVYGTETNDSARPVPTENDKKFKKVLTAGKTFIRYN